ncbi:MAG TPA: hypothetical protein VK629_08140 [Steroidobacteraceae bacterium]|nr:hypothetical protein [Steroidobacteraceae bacterium]
MMPISPLRQSFRRARASGNIDEVMPFFIAAKFFVAGKKIPTAAAPVFFIQRSPNPERWCVTASESSEVLAKHDVDLIEHTGKSLLAAIEPTQEIVIAYADGGDYLTLEQLDYFRGLQTSKP